MDQDREYVERALAARQKPWAMRRREAVIERLSSKWRPRLDDLRARELTRMELREVRNDRNGIDWIFYFSTEEAAHLLEDDEEGERWPDFADLSEGWMAITRIAGPNSWMWSLDALWERWRGEPWIGGERWEKKAWSKLSAGLARAERDRERALGWDMPAGLMREAERALLREAALGVSGAAPAGEPRRL